MFRLRSLLVPLLACLLALPSDAGQMVLVGAARVIDGDTFEISGTRIRIGGIDAPERAESCTHPSGAVWACGRWAWYETERLFQGQVLRCVDLGARSHDRMVARCYFDGRDVAETLIDQGIARVCPRYAAEQGVLEVYAHAEDRARDREAGIFAGPLNPPAGFCALRQSRAELANPAPEGDCMIKGNVSGNGRIYHLPGQAHYDRVNMNHPDKRWFCSEAEAQQAGWRPAER